MTMITVTNLSFLLCMLTVNANPIYKYCCPSAGECTSVNVSKYHLHDENPRALEEWTHQNELHDDINCPSNGAFNTNSPMIELVMMASPRCRESNDPRYYIETLGDHKSNSIYRIDIASGSPPLDMYYRYRNDYCTNKATIMVRHNLIGQYPKGASFTALVTPRNVEISDSDADVLVRAEPEGYHDGVIYTVYNTTNGTDSCTQKYAPLMAEYIESEYINGTQLTVRWRGQDHSDGYILVVGDSCTAQRPCAIVKNTTKVTIKFANNSLDKIRIYNIITTNCTNTEIGDELAYLFKGCKDDCCLNSNHYHDPTSVKTTTEPSNGTTVATPTTESDCDTTEATISSTTPYPTHTHVENSIAVTTTNSSTLIEIVANQPNKNMTVIASAIAIPLAVVMIVVSLLLSVRFIICIRNCKSERVSCEGRLNDYIISPRTKFPSVHVLVIYSSNTVEKERRLIFTMISELESYGIKTLSHDLRCIQGGPSTWLESEVKKATSVLCICNKEFKDEWEGQSHPSLPLVKSLRHLIQGTLQTAESLSKYAVVLLNPSHRQYIPTKYLQSESRQFIMADMEAIAQHVLNMPHCELSKDSTIDTPDSSA